MKTVHALAVVAATVAATVSATPAHAASFLGSTVDVTYYLPDSSTPYPGSSGDYVVGAGVEVPNLVGEVSLDISASSILVNFFREATFSNYAFNGWVLSDQSNNLAAITGVTINPASTLGGFNQSNVSWSADSISVNWSGLSFTSETILLLDVTFASTAVPEPGTWAMMLIGFGAMGLYLRRRNGSTRARLAIRGV